MSTYLVLGSCEAALEAVHRQLPLDGAAGAQVAGGTEVSSAPVSVLAKHYVDLSPQKLKQVHDQAGLRVLAPKAQTAEYRWEQSGSPRWN